MDILKAVVIPVLTAGTMSMAAYGDGIKIDDTVQNCKSLFAKEYWQMKKEKHFNAAYEICTKNHQFRMEVLKGKCNELNGKIREKILPDGSVASLHCRTKWGNLTDDMLTKDDFINIDETPRH